jgi:hypothetical protein
LRLYAEASTAVIEDIVGPVNPRTCTETLEGRADTSARNIVVLSLTPVISVTSITPQMQGLYTPDLAALVIDTTTGVLKLSNWFPFYGPMTVIYVAGRTSIPANLKLAAMEQFRFMWQLGQQGDRFGGGGDSTEWAPSGFAVPRRVIELCAPNRRAPGIA